ncbi:hypothetical protein [Coleofasciculus sp. LEGE 07081]|nr:hypothetical protein [Coleofasciculus sp. LEGE 07081]
MARKINTNAGAKGANSEGKNTLVEMSKKVTEQVIACEMIDTR